ncbi:MAG: phosphoglucosamine mutase [Candidatus Micrarchaeota archaeon]
MFGTSGIRGLANVDVTVELAARVGAALVDEAGETVAVGRDTRATGEMLESALCAGIVSRGGNALRLGVAPTPTTALACARRNFCFRKNAHLFGSPNKLRECKGVMITASHNPPEYNGIKIFANGMEIDRGEERKISERVDAKAKMQLADWKSVGGIDNYEGAIREHIDSVLKLVDVGAIQRRKPKVVIDCGNGAGCVVTPYALREAGCKVIGVNCEQSGEFARGLEPNDENLLETKKMVRAVGADLGIAHDGDADRAIIIDEKGELLGLDAQLAIMCDEILSRKKGTIVSTLEASLAVRESVEGKGRKLVTTAVGSLNVAREMKKNKAVFGGEPCGEYIFPEEMFVPDGVLSALKFVEIFCRRGKLSALRERIKTYPMKRVKIKCARKEEAMGKIKKEIENEFHGRVNDVDGVRVDFEGGWLLVRASGTEPIIRITSENKNEKKLEEIVKRAEMIVKKFA